MFAKTKFPTFIDSLVVEFEDLNEDPVTLVLKDEKGCVCGTLEIPSKYSLRPTSFGLKYDDMEGLRNEEDNDNVRPIDADGRAYKWGGFSELPYGVYYIEGTSGSDEFRHRIVKRV